MSEEKFLYTINEAAAILGEKASVLRFWEKEFEQLKPRKSAGGRRQYTREELALLKRIHHYTRVLGYTLEGVKEQLKKPAAIDEARLKAIEGLKETRDFLVGLKRVLDE